MYKKRKEICPNQGMSREEKGEESGVKKLRLVMFMHQHPTR